MRVILISLLMLAVGSGPGFAQDQVSSHERAAAEFIEVLQLERLTMASLDVIKQSMASQDPNSAELAEVLAEFTRKYLRWEDMRPEYIRIYRDAYTEAELRRLIVFYRTPVGQKTVEITPALMKQSSEVSQKLLKEHLPELQQMLRVRIYGGGS